MAARRWTWNSAPPERELDEVASLLGRGGVVVLPTDTIYGLHACAANDEAVERLVAIKGRHFDKPLLVIAADIQDTVALGVEISSPLRAALAAVWPAPLTAVLPLRHPIAASRGASSLAVRLPDLPWMRQLLRRTGPLASTSANRSGEPPISAAAVPPDMEERIDGIVAGPILVGKPSTIVDFTSAEPRVLRQGEFLFTQNLWKTLRNSL